MHLPKVQGAKRQQGLDLAAAAVAAGPKMVEVVEVVVGQRVGHWNESQGEAEEEEEGVHSSALVSCSEAGAAEAGQEPR